jgi:hypothetical protein
MYLYISADTIFMEPSKNSPKRKDFAGYADMHASKEKMAPTGMSVPALYQRLGAHYLWVAGRNVQTQQN